MEIADEPDIRTNLLASLSILAVGKESMELLREAVRIGGNLIAAAQAAYTLRMMQLGPRGAN